MIAATVGKNLPEDQDPDTLASDILSDITVHMKYARYLPEKKRRENWRELCYRNEAMHIQRFPEFEKEIKEIYKDFIIPKKLLPSMRMLQFSGKPIAVNPSRGYNCAALTIDCTEAFAEVMFLLLGGTGVGYSVQKQHVRKLPIIQGVINPTGRGRKKRYLVGDSIEGWADAIKALINAYFNGTKEIDFDLSDIRPKGTLLVTAGGKAPGSGPLRKCIAHIVSIFENALEERGRGTKLTPLECHDICCHIADSVLAGGIRRSACICLFSLDDQDMLYCKSGVWYEKNPQRARANNSAVLIRGLIKKREFKELWNIIKNSKSGEPGIFFSNDPNNGLCNPCSRPTTPVLIKNGITEFANINIGDEIWSEDNWVKITNKWSNGIKEVYRYRTNAGVFYGTKNHNIINNGQREEVDNATAIDVLTGQFNPNLKLNLQDIMDGLVIGDGSCHNRTSKYGGTIILHIGQDDSDYHNSEIKHLILQYRPGIQKTAWAIKTSIFNRELPPLPTRVIPDRFFYGNPNIVAGFLRGLYSANGSICGKRVTLKSSCAELVEQVQLMLSSLGIISYITKNKPSTIKFRNGTYTCKKSYDINISSDRDKFQYNIGFLQKYKAEKLKQLVDSIPPNGKQKLNYDIISKELISEEEVFDITVDGKNHTYWSGGHNVSNCCEIALKSQQFCNLDDINASTVESQEDFNARVRAAAIIGTLQASYTNFHYLRDEWAENCEKEALLGISMTGIASNKLKNINLTEGAKIAVDVNKEWAKKIGINPAHRITTGKPAASTSLTAGCSSGIHAWHAKYYLRRIRVGKDESIYKYLKRRIPQLVEDEVFSPNDTAVISIPQKAPRGALTRDKESPIELLERVKKIHTEWIVPGHKSGANTHNQSVTVSIKDNEWDEVFEWMWTNKNSYNGISVLPYDGGTYVQAPFEEITKDKYEEMLPYLKKVNLDHVTEEEDNTDLKGELACAGGACEI